MKSFKLKNRSVKIFTKESAALAAAAVVLTGLFAGCTPKEAAAATAGQPPVYAVSAVTVEKARISDYLTLSGDMVAGSSVDVFSDTAGTITRRFVSIGSAVYKGQPVAEVDPSQPGMQYIPSTVRAPIAGVVSSLPGQVGMKITQSSSIAVISGGGGLEIQLNVAERFIYRIRMGLPCEITLDAYPDDSFRGRVSEISPVIDVSSRTMRIKVNVNNPGNKLKAGMFANVKIITEEKNNVITVPDTAVLQRAGEQFVYTIAPDPADAAFNIAKRTTVTTGLNVDNMVEITSGLEAGDRIVVRGQTTFTDGSRVNIVQ